jgi:hypothetical protein
MVKMNKAVDLEAQQISKLNEHLHVANKIWKAGRNACQGNGWLRNKLLNPNGDGTLIPPPPISSKGSVLTKRFIGPQVHNDRISQSGMCIPSLESPPLKNPDYGSKAPTVLATLRGSARQPLSITTNEAAGSGSNDSHNGENVHRPP